MKNITIICEGKTENNYIQALNNFIWNAGIENIVLTSININGCTTKNYLYRINNCFIKELRQKVSKVFIWLDKDIFIRANKNIDDIKTEIIKKLKSSGSKNKNTEIEIIFNTMNGEDLMMLHESKEISECWSQTLQKCNHATVPLESKDVQIKINEINKQYKTNYKKGNAIILNDETLKNFKSNNENPLIQMHSEIIELIKEIGL